MMRLSGTIGSRPCSINRCFCTPLISILTVLADDAVADGRGIGQRSAGVDPQLLEGAQRGARCSADVVDTTLQAVELFDDRQRDDDVGIDEAADARRVGDEHRGVEHDPSSHTSP